MSDSDEVLPKKRSADQSNKEADKKLKAQEHDSDYEPTDNSGSEELDPDLYSDEYDHGDVEDFDAEAYLRFCQKADRSEGEENGIPLEEDDLSEESEAQKPTSCSQDQDSSSEP